VNEGAASALSRQWPGDPVTTLTFLAIMSLPVLRNRYRVRSQLALFPARSSIGSNRDRFLQADLNEAALRRTHSRVAGQR
jgi:hypothetical protein